MSELKPCPFCGSKATRIVRVAIKYERQEWWRGKCDGCKCYGSIADKKDESIELWNRRTEKGEK
jgi:Lar family restriction alleviation protein